MSLTSAQVTAIFEDSLATKDEIDAQTLKELKPILGVLGVNYVMNRVRLEYHKAEIVEMLGELPDGFNRSGGGGMSFLNACFDKHEHQWTGSHQVMDQLFMLGIATEKVECLVPREMWPALPGGMPYYVIID